MTDLIKKIKLDLSNIPKNKHKQVKDEVGNYLINQILRDVERGFSPVEGEGQFQQLTLDYAVREKQGRRVANLELEGDLKEALRFKRTDDGIEIGNMLKKQAPKADGHNQHSAKAIKWAAKTGFPKRRYIPKDKQKFREPIEKQIETIVKSFEEQDDTTTLGLRPEEQQTLTVEPTVTITSIFEDDFIEQEIRRQLENGN